MALKTMSLKQARELLSEEERKGWRAQHKALLKLIEVADIDLGGLSVDTITSDRSYSSRSRQGVKVYFSGTDCKRVWRAVKDTGEGIDLDKLRGKVEELKALKAEADEARKNKRERQKRQSNAQNENMEEAKRLLQEAGLDDGRLRYLSGVYLGDRDAGYRKRVELNARPNGVRMTFTVSPEKMMKVLALLEETEA